MFEKVPKIFHQVWLEGPVPEPFQYFTEHLLELHPGWEYKLWTLKNIPELVNKNLFKHFSLDVFKADLIRYEVLLKYGGVYLDTDFLIYKNLESCFEKANYLFIEEWPKKITNSLIGIPENHFLMEYVVRKIPENMRIFEANRKKIGEHNAGLHTIGPIHLHNCIKELMPEAKSWAPKYFCPFSYSDTKLNEAELKSYPEAYGIHLWNYCRGHKSIQVHKTLPCYKRKFRLI
jgi:mannosyltransferase OCH1-like enzyme